MFHHDFGGRVRLGTYLRSGSTQNSLPGLTMDSPVVRVDGPGEFAGTNSTRCVRDNTGTAFGKIGRSKEAGGGVPSALVEGMATGRGLVLCWQSSRGPKKARGGLRGSAQDGTGPSSARDV